MKDLNYFSYICIALEPVDFRKQRNGLCLLVKGYLEENPLKERSLFAFINKRKDSIRLLYWDGSGFALWSKTLERERYYWLRDKGKKISSISSKELKWLLQGIDIKKIKKHENVNFSSVC